MSVNKYQPHILVLPEDDAIRQIANGFIQHSKVNHRVIQVLPISGGWGKVVEQFEKDYAPRMSTFPERIMVLLIDFDEQKNRFDYVRSHIPEELKKRVFVLGIQSEAENLKREVQMDPEEIGDTLAADCIEKNGLGLWQHELLKQNEAELESLASVVGSFLFG